MAKMSKEEEEEDIPKGKKRGKYNCVRRNKERLRQVSQREKDCCSVWTSLKERHAHGHPVMDGK
jgi:hypothetical protein